MPYAVVDLLGPLNGIFCVVGKSGRMVLLNPAMRQFRPLPLHDRNVQPPLCVDNHELGFGLDPLSGDYKLVSLWHLWNEEMNNEADTPLVSIYNSGSNSWRNFEDMNLVYPTCFMDKSLCNTYLNGVYYWLVEFNDTDIAIIAFDMTAEKFQEIKVPDCVTSEERNFRLVLNGDSLALLSYDYFYKNDKCVDVWVMQNEGCWTKISTFGPFRIRRPLGFWKNDEILLETGISLLILYNVSTQKLSAIRAETEQNGFYLNWVFSYKESLVSIKGEGDNCKLWDTSSDFVKDFFK